MTEKEAKAIVNRETDWGGEESWEKEEKDKATGFLEGVAAERKRCAEVCNDGTESGEFYSKQILKGSE